MAEKADSYYFDVSWEVCAKSGDRPIFIKQRLRSAVRNVGRYYYIAGPDLKSRPEFTEIDESRQDFLDVLHSSGSTGWRIPGEPRAVYANFGRKMNARFKLYELWEDSGLVIDSSGRDCLEPIILNHASGSILELFSYRNTGSSGAESFFGTGRLCVKKKADTEPETILDSSTTFTGRLNGPGSTNIYFETGKLHDKTRGIIQANRPAAPAALVGLSASGPVPQLFRPLTVFQEMNSGVFTRPANSPPDFRSDPPPSKFVVRLTNDGTSTSSFLWILHNGRRPWST